MSGTLIVGDNTKELETWAKKHYPTSQLITNDSAAYVTTGVYYTSLADITEKNLLDVANKVKTVIYHSLPNWSSTELKEQTEFVLTQVNKHVVNLSADPENFLTLAGERKDKGKQLWISGCSFAHGVGVDPILRYGQLIADNLSLPVTFLTAPASNIPWAADQILRSDIQKDDIVVWGLTSVNRYTAFLNKSLHFMTVGVFDSNSKNLRDTAKIVNNEITSSTQKELKKNLFSQERMFQAITSIFQVINYCQKVGAKLIIVNHKLSDFEFDFMLARYVYAYQNFIELSDIIDYSDNEGHPGVQTHATWGREITNKIITKGW